jgi:ribose 5-phosphate isomerase B
MEVFISSDHAGFKLKKIIGDYLKEKGFHVTDMGPYELNEQDDYPDFVIPLAKKVAEDIQNKGILICKNGVGVSMTANKLKGIRAALSWNVAHAKSSRNDDDANVLALPAGYISEVEAKEITEVWLNTPFEAHDRFIRRLGKVAEVEKL